MCKFMFLHGWPALAAPGHTWRVERALGEKVFDPNKAAGHGEGSRRRRASMILATVMLFLAVGSMALQLGRGVSHVHVHALGRQPPNMDAKWTPRRKSYTPSWCGNGSGDVYGEMRSEYEAYARLQESEAGGAAAVANHGKGFAGGEATRDPEPTVIDPNDPKREE